MSQGTKNQFYRYSMRCTMVGQNSWCAKRILLWQRPPDNALSIENLYCHVRILFDSGLSAGEKKLARIGIVSGYPAYAQEAYESRYKYLDINISADGSNYVDLTIDLTSLLDKTAIGDPANDENATLVILTAGGATSDSIADNLASAGTIELWKLDGIYTTREIR